MTRTFDRTRLLGPAIALAVVLFLAVYVMAHNLLGGARIDFTADRLYTLSEGTRKTLADIREPVRLRLYQSEGLTQSAPQFKAYADRVQQMLRTYVALSGGRVQLEVVNPQPFSPEEDRAMAFGLQAIALNGSGDRGFFGLAGTNSTGDQQVIPFFTPDRESFLEYDLTRLVYALANPGKPVVALIDGLGLAGTMQTRFQSHQVLEQMRQFFEVRILGGDLAEIGPDVQVLMLAHPQNLSDATLYAIDQFVLRGGRLIAFVDPFAERQQGMRPGMPPPNPSSNLEKLFDAWGVRFTGNQVVGDRQYAVPVQAQSGGRQAIIGNLPWLQLREEAHAKGDVVTDRLGPVILTSAGAFSLKEGAGVALMPLLQSSPDAALLATEEVQAAGGDPRQLLRGFQPAGQPFTLAARLRGEVGTAFPGGRPEGAPKPDQPREHLARSQGPVNVVLVGDADMLTDDNWAQIRQGQGGQRTAVPFAANADFALNAVDNLAGGEALLGLRGRGLSDRPFTVVQDLSLAAEARFRQTEQDLLQKLQDAERRMQELGRGQQVGKDGQLILSPEQQQEIERFRGEMLQTRAELRDVQHALRRDIDRLEAWLTAINVAAMPLLVILAGVLAVLFRPTRRAPPPPAAGAA